jgi:hypothetical protein
MTLVLLQVWGCQGSDPKSSEDDDSQSFEVAFDLNLATIVPTVATVGWSSGADIVDAAWLEYGLADDFDKVLTLPLDGSDSFLVGLKGGRTYQARVVVEQDGSTSTSDVLDFETGSPPSELSEVSVEVLDATAASDGYLVTTHFAGPAMAVILDTDGDYVWWYAPPEISSGSSPTSVPLSRASLSADGQSVILWGLNARSSAGKDQPDPKKTTGQMLVQVALDGTSEKSIPLEDGHHDFAVLPDGTIAYLEYDQENKDDLEGDRIVELRPDGEKTEVWTFADHFGQEKEMGATGPGQSWSHANGLDYVEEEDAYYLSSLGFDCIVKIDRSSGTAEWVIGGRQSDFKPDSEPENEPGSEPETYFERQHQFQRLDDGIVIFNNGGEDTYSSEVVELVLDVENMTMEEVWSYTPDPEIYTFALGEVQRLDSGNTFATFSTQGQIDEIDPDGQLVWRLQMSLGGALGYATFVESLNVEN